MPTTRHVVKIRQFASHQAPYSIIIPAAGTGKRMRSYGPKSLIKLTATTTLLSHQIYTIRQVWPNAEIILVTGFQAAKVMNRTPHSIIQIENEYFETTNVIRSIGMGLRAATHDHVIVLHGDLVFNTATLQNWQLNKRSTLMIDTSKLMGDNEVGCVIHDNHIEHVFYNVAPKWAQIAFFTGRELKLLKSIAWNVDKMKLFSFEAINDIIDRGGRFTCSYSNYMQIMDIDSSKDLQYVRTHINEHFISPK